MLVGLRIIIIVAIMGGIIAFIGDKLGTKIGKRRMSLFGLRPKHTSIIVTIVTGILIAAATLGILSIASQNVRTALFGMEQLKEEMRALNASVESKNKELEQSKKDILEQSDVIVITLKQGYDSMKAILDLRNNEELKKKNNMIILAGKYDRYSRFNITNMSRELKEKRKISAIPYNTLFFEASSEGTVADFFIRYRTVMDQNDRNYLFLQETKRACDEILLKLQELQMRF